jgi:thiol-disulfide isomerase/thioredoxin
LNKQTDKTQLTRLLTFPNAGFSTMQSCKSFFVFLSVFVLCSANAEEFRTLHGRVVNTHNQPVADVDIATFWSANGILLQAASNSALSAGRIGSMEPLGASPAKSGEDGRFSMQLDWRNYFLLAMDKERKQGAFLICNPNNESSIVEAKLAPLVRVYGKTRFAATGEAPKSSTVIVRLPSNEAFPLCSDRVAVCGPESRFECRLPPGNYLLEARAEVSTPQRLISYESIRSIAVPAGGRDLDAGVLELTPAAPTTAERITNAKATGTWGEVDATKLIGKPAPNWYAVDARGIDKTAVASDFKGKWVLIYLWSTFCAPCVGKTLPELAEFYNAHAEDRNRFEIVAICIEPEGALRTMGDFDQRLKPVVVSVWKGKSLPFPVVLDNTFETMKRFGVVGLPQKFLIDPQGRIVKGDEQVLAENLQSSRLKGSSD